MIICIGCVEHAKDLQDNYYRNPDVYPFGECGICHQNAPLTDGYRAKETGKFFDMHGKEVAVGDRIAYSVAAGRSSGKMIVGKIYAFGLSTIRVESTSIDWNSGMSHRSIQTVRSYFNYHPSKFLRL